MRVRFPVTRSAEPPLEHRQLAGWATQLTQNSLPSGSAMTVKEWPHSSCSWPRVAPSPTRWAISASRSSVARSTWTRFFVTFASGTLAKNQLGESSSVRPIEAKNSLASGSSGRPSAADQNSATLRTSSQSNVTLASRRVMASGVYGSTTTRSQLGGRPPGAQAGPPCRHGGAVVVVAGAELSGQCRFLVPADERGDHQPHPSRVSHQDRPPQQQCLSQDDRHDGHVHRVAHVAVEAADHELLRGGGRRRRSAAL